MDRDQILIDPIDNGDTFGGRGLFIHESKKPVIYDRVTKPIYHEKPAPITPAAPVAPSEKASFEASPSPCIAGSWGIIPSPPILLYIMFVLMVWVVVSVSCMLRKIKKLKLRVKELKLSMASRGVGSVSH